MVKQLDAATYKQIVARLIFRVASRSWSWLGMSEDDGNRIKTRYWSAVGAHDFSGLIEWFRSGWPEAYIRLFSAS